MARHAKVGGTAALSSLGFVLALALGACGDDDDDGSRAGSGGDAATAGTGGTGARGGSGGTGGSGMRDGGGGTGTDAAAGGTGGTDDDGGAVDEDGGAADSRASFFVSSETNMTGDLGGLAGADDRCQTLAEAVGLGGKTWHAYLSVENDPANGGNATDARDRIGDGPFINVKGATLAADLDALHAIKGDAELFLDEHGEKIPGQWPGSPSPVEHDILTGSNADGTVMADMTCDDWTSDSANMAAQVGHSDGLGPGMNPDPPYSSWNPSHANESCANTRPRGGSGRIYCFAVD